MAPFADFGRLFKGKRRKGAISNGSLWKKGVGITDTLLFCQR